MQYAKQWTMVGVVGAILVSAIGFAITLVSPGTAILAKDNRPVQPSAILGAEGRISLLRVHDVGTQYGAPPDQLDVEVVIRLENQPGKAFGFQLRDDTDGAAAGGMLKLLRTAFSQDEPVRIDYETVGPNSGRILRLMIVPPEPSFQLHLPLIRR